MSDLRTAAQQALEALKSCSGVPHWPALQPTICALRAALAQQDEPVQLRELLIQAASMAVAAERAGKYGGASWVADAVLEDCPKKQAEPLEPVAWMCSSPELMAKGYKRFSSRCEGDWNIPVYLSPAQA